MRRSIPVLLSLVTAMVACTETVVHQERAQATPDPEATEEPKKDSGPIPSVALEADPSVDCPAAYRDTAPKEGRNVGFIAAEQEREFTLLLPSGATTASPLLIAFNGTGESGPAFAARARLSDFVARGFIVLAPSSKGNGTVWPVWDGLRQPGTENEPNKDLEFFDQVVKCVAGHHAVDKNRVYVAGHSAGGIMTNHVLQRRSQLLAGGVVGSGVFSLSSPKPAEPLDSLFVIVTWGGDNDIYSGSAGGVSIGGFNFVSEASLASQYYDGQDKVREINCRGDNLGHAWLSDLNGWFADQLLAHPKGTSLDGPYTLPALPSGARASCQDAPFSGPDSLDVVCQDSSTNGCREVCQFFGDCAVENGTVGPSLAPQLEAIGFSGPKNVNCGGCVTRCEAQAKTASDAAALACFKQHQSTATCGQGLDGAFPLVEAVNQCCQNRSDSPYCVGICTEINKNSSARAFFSTCATLGQ